jgi:hypothetical protein
MEKVKKIVNSVEFHCLLAAVVFITICSKSSFFYPLNDWGDVDCYYTIGLGMIKGLVPYRDLYDQKGIVIFSLYAIANLISTTSFVGGYILEIISAFFFLLITMKIAGLFGDVQRYSLPLCFIVAGSVFSSASICHGGSAEELLLPVFTYGIYLCIKQVVNKNIPSGKEMFVFGIFAGLIFFSKFTLCAFYLALIVVMIIDAAYNNNVALLFKRAGLFICGCILVCIPVIVYFAYNHALGDMFTAYFYNNIFHYIPSDPDIDFLFRTSTFFRKRNILPIILLALSFIYCIRKRKRMVLFGHIVVFLSIFYMQFFVGFPQKYYGIPLYSLIAVGLNIVVDLFDRWKTNSKKYINAIILVLMIAIAFIFTNNKYMLFQKKEDTRQFILAEKMNSYGYDDYHMLSYNNLDDGYYFATGKFPNFRAFIQDNLDDDILVNEQNAIIDSGSVEFIVTKKILCDTKDYEKAVDKYGEKKVKDITAFDNFKYELVDETNQFYEDEYFLVKLYKLKD